MELACFLNNKLCHYYVPLKESSTGWSWPTVIRPNMGLIWPGQKHTRPHIDPGLTNFPWPNALFTHIQLLKMRHKAMSQSIVLRLPTHIRIHSQRVPIKSIFHTRLTAPTPFTKLKGVFQGHDRKFHFTFEEPSSKYLSREELCAWMCHLFLAHCLEITCDGEGGLCEKCK